MNKNLEIMKKIVEEKKNKGKTTKNNKKAQKAIGTTSKGVKTGNGGGLFDK